MRKVFVRSLWTLLAIVILGSAVAFTAIWNGFIGYMPPVEDLQNPINRFATQIYSADGKVIGTWNFNRENRVCVSYNDISPYLVQALVATEDVRFYDHSGVDFIALGRAIVKRGLFGQASAGGGSTITQQLAKNMFRMRTNYSTGLLGMIPGVRMLIVKSKEWIIATKLEMTHNKNEILTMYANTVDFGSNAFGIKTAAKTYFNCSPKDLTVEQAAVLVGMLKATTYYNPLANPENSLRRRNVVLSNMVRHGDMTRADYDSISKIDIKLNYSVESNYDGTALYFREAVADELRTWCRDNDYDLYTSGLKIYTTIDSRMQKYAEEAAIKQMKQVQRNFNNHWGNQDPWQDENHNVIPGFIEGIAKRQPVYKYLLTRFPNNPDSIEYYLNRPHKVKLFDYEHGTIEKEMSTMDSIRYMVHFMHCSFVAMEPQTGAVKAWVGDIDFKSWKYDKVTAMRQPGSTFKLFVYTEAMNQGLTPCDKRRDEYFSMQVFDKKHNEEVTWAPTNANGYFTGDSIPLKAAFARSINSIAVRLGQEMGITRIAETAHKMGIESPLDETPALALGSSDINLLELANAYSTVANDGKYVKRVLVTRIVDRNGKEVYRAPTNEEQVIPYKSAFLMQQLLMGGTSEPGGTSMSLNGYVGKFRDTDWGGKTGTSNNHSDAWFMGVSPKLVVGAWVGGEYRCIHFRTGALGQGSRTALPICGLFLESVLNDPAFAKYRVKFGKPKDADITSSMYNCQSYYTREKTDSSHSDSIHVEEEIVLDENGAPIEHHKATEPAKEGSSEQPSTHKRPKEEAVNFDDL